MEAAKGLIEGWKAEQERLKARETALGAELEAVRAELAAAEEKVKAQAPAPEAAKVRGAQTTGVLSEDWSSPIPPIIAFKLTIK